MFTVVKIFNSDVVIVHLMNIWVFKGKQGYTRVNRGIQGYSRVNRGIQGYLRVNRNKFICNLVFQKDTSSRCVSSMYKPRKHDHVIYEAAKVAETSSCGRRLNNKSSDTFVFVIFYWTSKYYITFGKVADQGPHTVSHGIMFKSGLLTRESPCKKVNKLTRNSWRFRQIENRNDIFKTPTIRFPNEK